MLVGKSALNYVKLSKESQHLMCIDKSFERNQLLVTQSEHGKKHGDQYGKNIQTRDMSTIKCHYCEEFDHVQFKCPKFMKDLRKPKEKAKKLKSTPSSNVVSYENDLLLCEDEIDDKVKKCETLDEEMIYCVKACTHPSSTSNSGKKKEVNMEN